MPTEEEDNAIATKGKARARRARATAHTRPPHAPGPASPREPHQTSRHTRGQGRSRVTSATPARAPYIFPLPATHDATTRSRARSHQSGRFLARSRALVGWLVSSGPVGWSWRAAWLLSAPSRARCGVRSAARGKAIPPHAPDDLKLVAFARLARDDQKSSNQQLAAAPSVGGGAAGGNGPAAAAAVRWPVVVALRQRQLGAASVPVRR